MTKLISLLLPILLLAGCTKSAAPTIQYYDFAGIKPYTAMQLADSMPVLHVNLVQLPGILAQTGLVQRHSNVTATSANWHHWAQQPAVMLTEFSQRALANELPTLLVSGALVNGNQRQFQLQYHLDRFNGATSGAEIAGTWQLRVWQSGQWQLVAQQAFAQQQSLSSDGFAALVTALESLWLQRLQVDAQQISAMVDKYIEPKKDVEIGQVE